MPLILIAPLIIDYYCHYFRVFLRFHFFLFADIDTLRRLLRLISFHAVTISFAAFWQPAGPLSSLISSFAIFFVAFSFTWYCFRQRPWGFHFERQNFSFRYCATIFINRLSPPLAVFSLSRGLSPPRLAGIFFTAADFQPPGFRQRRAPRRLADAAIAVRQPHTRGYEL